MEVLRTENVSKNFDGVRALNKVSFSVEAGEKLAIIGPNGAGKTTLMNVLNGVLPASEGQIYFSGKEITHFTTHKRSHLGMGRSFQNDTLIPHMSVMDNLLLAVHGAKTSRYSLFTSFGSYKNYNNEAQTLLESVNLWEKRDDVVDFISHGERKKLEIATSLASQPKVLLLDEPNAGLSNEESADIVELIRSMLEDKAVLIVAHDMDLVFNLADEILVLHYGEVIAKGSPEAIKADIKVKEIYMGIDSET
jgi:branched-chain amino acid transport system ATP-binding protein